MKKLLQVLAFSLVIGCVSGDADSVSYYISECQAEGKPNCGQLVAEYIEAGLLRRRLGYVQRRLGGDTPGPCSGFSYAKEQNPTCPAVPSLNADMQQNSPLSVFAREWIDYTCCNIVTKDMNGIVPTIWLWLQVCTKAMNKARADENVYTTDEAYSKTMWGANEAKPYGVGPLKIMKHYCPQDLDGGELTEWMVATFYPVMEAYNPNFKTFNKQIKKCTPKKTNGAVTVLLTSPPKRGAIGHIAMVMHKDHELGLPEDHNNDEYVSFSNMGNTIGAMITGTKAVHVGFGKDLSQVSHTITLYNVDVDAMLTKWKAIKQSRQQFDLMKWNCGRAMLEVLKMGYPGCEQSLDDLDDQLWTPQRAYSLVEQLATDVNADAPATNNAKMLEDIRESQIVPKGSTRTVRKGVPLPILVAAALGSFFGTLLVAGIVAGILIMKMKADAAAMLDRRLAALLIQAAKAPSDSGGPATGAKYVTEGAPSKQNVKNKNSVAPIYEEMDTTKDGETDFAEFSTWAKNHNLSEKQAKMMWKDLDRNHDKHVTSKEWERYIKKRPHLNWLVTRLQSCRKLTPQM